MMIITKTETKTHYKLRIGDSTCDIEKRWFFFFMTGTLRTIFAVINIALAGQVGMIGRQITDGVIYIEGGLCTFAIMILLTIGLFSFIASTSRSDYERYEADRQKRMKEKGKR